MSYLPAPAQNGPRTAARAISRQPWPFLPADCLTELFRNIFRVGLSEAVLALPYSHKSARTKIFSLGFPSLPLGAFQANPVPHVVLVFAS